MSDRSPEALVREEVRAMQAYHVAPAAGLVKLDAMENPYRLPEPLAAEMGARLAEVAVNRYPDPSGGRLKEVLRDAMGLPSSQQIVLGIDADGDIYLRVVDLLKFRFERIGVRCCRVHAVPVPQAWQDVGN